MRIALVAGFMVTMGRFWHPYYGFTQFLQANEETEASLPASLRDAPVYISRGEGRYDGAYYALIATAPGLRDPELRFAVGDLGYRARRILLSAVAWLAGRGDPVSAVHAYAWLNVLLWFVLAGLLWRIFPVSMGLGGTMAWLCLLCGAVLLSVRLALTDLAALAFLAAAVQWVAQGRRVAAAGLLGLAGLARETGLLGLAMLWPDEGLNPRLWLRRAGLVVLAAAPLVGWLLLIRWVPGSASTGTSNLSLPFTGLFGRAGELLRLNADAATPALPLFAWFDYAALLVQMTYLLIFPQKSSPWWRIGITYVLLALCLGHPVWEGFPGASTRVLLPMTLAYNVLVVQRRASWGWLVAGNLMVFSSLWALTGANHPSRELNSRATWSYSSLLETDRRWSQAEWNRKWRWAWCASEGGLILRRWPHRERLKVELQVRGVTPRPLEVVQAGKVVWRGVIGDRPQWITLPELPASHGRLELVLRSEAPPTEEGSGPTRRAIGFACFAAREID